VGRDFKGMSDVTDQYLLRTKLLSKNHWTHQVIRYMNWKVKQSSLVTGSHSVNEEDLRKNSRVFSSIVGYHPIHELETDDESVRIRIREQSTTTDSFIDLSISFG
jgi:hypothetical protein